MRFVAVIIGLALLPPLAAGQDDAARTASDMVRAANTRAVVCLYERIAALPVARGATVGDLLDQTGGRSDMLTVLEKAEQIGAPRWVDDKTVQVRLEVSGEVVLATVKRIAATNSQRTPANPAQIELVARQWKDQTIAATGTSTSVTALPAAALGPCRGKWERVDAKARQAALAAARQDAVRRVVDSVKPVAVNGRTLGDLLDMDAVGKDIYLYIESVPVDRVDFGDDLTVTVSLGMDDREFFDVVKKAIQRQTRVAMPESNEAWAAIRKDFVTRLARPVGVATATGEAGRNPRVIPLPREAPEWARSHIESEGYSDLDTSRLKAAAAAETDARHRLRTSVDALPIAGTTIGHLAREDTIVDSAITRALARARVTRTQYPAGGGARVWIDLDLSDIWDQIRR